MLSELERILCDPRTAGSIERLMPYADDSWALQFPDLRALPKFDREARPLRFCIATEEIVGPVRNGGIGTTYAALAEMLAQQGHDITILYLRGQDVENADVAHWVQVYKDKGIHFVPVPSYAAIDNFRPAAQRWLHPSYNMLRYLLDHPMDVVHVSEWHGCGYLSLLAKRQGLMLGNTLFIVKASSPWMWNRLYGSQSLERVEDLMKIHAERQSIELADMVIGGSSHLLRWMSSQGYRIPRAATFVQPNVASFAGLRDLMAKHSIPPGTRLPVEEIVIFGRLEARKGLFTFCKAIRRLVRLGVKLPPRVSFMGKPGARFPFRPQQEILDFLAEETADWPTQVSVLTEFQQYEALQYLLNGARLAVMPSNIENSSLAVYEAAICGIPFVASSVGGTPELIAAEDHAHVLCEPHPLPLAEKIAEALSKGGYVATPSFDNEANLDCWRQFNDQLGRGLLEHLIPPAGVAAEPEAQARPRVSVCVYHTGDVQSLLLTLESLKGQDQPPDELLIAVDADHARAAEAIAPLAAASAIPCRIVEAYDLDAGLAFNLLAEQAGGDFLLFLWEGSSLRPYGVRALATVARKSGADVLTYFHRAYRKDDAEGQGDLKAVIFGSITDAFFHTEMSSLPLFVKKTAFEQLRGFTGDYRVLAYDYEFVAKAQLAGVKCETALMELGAVLAWDEAWLSGKCYDMAVSSFRAIRPLLAAAPLSLRDLLLLSKGLRVRADAARGKRAGEKKPPALDEQGQMLRIMRGVAARTGSPAKDGPGQGPAAAGDKARAQKPARAKEPLLQLIDAEIYRVGTAAVVKPAPAAAKAVAAAGEASPKAANLAKREARQPPKAAPKAGVIQGLTGRVLAVRNGVVYGWACDGSDSRRIVNVEVIEGGRVLQVVPSGLELPAASVIAHPMKGHGFMIALNASRLPASLLRGYRRLSGAMTRRGLNYFFTPQHRFVSLRIQGSNRLLVENLAVATPKLDISQSDYRGCCDPNEQGLIQGWVWKPEAPDEMIDVAIFVDGQFAGRIAAHDYREDLREQHMGHGQYGFSMRLPRAAHDKLPRLVEVMVADEGVLLSHAPLRIIGRRVRGI